MESRVELALSMKKLGYWSKKGYGSQVSSKDSCDFILILTFLANLPFLKMN
jgi:hypothetical protein